jgi:hypothetical protein
MNCWPSFNAFAVLFFDLGCFGLVRRTLLAEKPNMILIMADDLGFNPFGCYGAIRVSLAASK